MVEKKFPFRESLIPTRKEGYFSRLHEFEKDNRFVVKKLKGFEPGKERGNWPDAKDTMEGRARKIKRKLETLETYVGDFLPKTHIIIGQSGENVSLYIIQEKIEGIRLSTIDDENSLNAELAEEIDNLFSQSLQMYFDTYNERTDMGAYPDVSDANVLIGKLADLKESDHIYLVDTYPFLKQHPTTLLDSLKRRMKHSPFCNLSLPKINKQLKKLEKLTEQ